MFQFSCRFACYHGRYRLSNCIPKITRACCVLQSFLAAVETQNFVNNLRNWWSLDPPPHVKFLLSLRFVFLTQQQRLNCVDVYISMRTASAAAQTPVDCSELHQQPVDAVLRPTFVHKLCYKLPSIVTFTFLQTFVFFTERRQSCRVCLIQCQNSRYFRCLIWKTKSL